MTKTPVSKLLDLTGKSAIVTGAGRGLGKAIALRFAEAGAAVTISDINAETAVAAADEIKASGGKAQGMRGDARKASDAEKLVQAALDAFGSVDILVNNAGLYPAVPVLDMSEEQWDLVLDTNLRGVLLHSQVAARAMIKGGKGGRIVNLASMATFKPQGALAHYDASKAGVAALTKSLAYELAPHNILVNAVAPGYMMTEGTTSGEPLDEKVAKLITFRPENLLLGRMGEPDDIAKAILFFVSGAADYITGSLLVVDGGYLVA